MNGYDLTRSWFDFCFENPEKINPSHTAIYCFSIEHCNRLGWKDKFGFPTMMVCDALGIKKASTYIKYFNDLVDWGFINMIERSTNQYSSNIISLVCAKPKNGKALDKAIMNHRDKQTVSTGLSKVPIDKQLNNKTTKLLNNPFSDSFLSIWDRWKEYKREEYNFKYKSVKTENTALEGLLSKSNGDEETAIKIIHQSISNGWKGFFGLKNNNNEKREQVSNIARQIIEQYPNL